MSKAVFKYEPTAGSYPGESVLDAIYYHAELVSGLSINTLTKLVKNIRPIDAETAKGLSKLSGEPEFWLALQAQHDKRKAQEISLILEFIRIMCEKYPHNAFGWLPKDEDGNYEINHDYIQAHDDEAFQEALGETMERVFVPHNFFNYYFNLREL